MEAIRPRHEAVPSSAEGSDANRLAPAPAPFPVELIAQLEEPEDAPTSTPAQGTSRQRQSSWITTPQAPQPATMGAHQDVMPPEYEYDRRQSQDSDLVSLPSYREDEEPVRVKGQEKHAEQRAGPSTSVANRLSANGIRRAEGGTDDKMLRELDDVTGAIERQLSVSPALEDQRVSLPAQSTGQSSSTARRREISQRMDRAKMSELEELWDKIEAAHGKGRSHADGQRADLSEWERRKEERRTRFLEGLLDHGEAGRLAGQDSPRGVVNGQDETARAQKQAAFMDDVAARSRAGRLSEQEYPTSMEDRLEQRRQRLIDSILDFSSSGRLNDQDSAPPTPRAVRADLAAEDSGEEVTLDEYIRTSQSGSSRMGRRDSAISLSSQKSAKGGSRSRSGSGGNLLDEGRKSPAPFKKLAGLVRKSSSGLNLRLPTPGSLDSGSIAYVAEYQENLRVVHVIVHGPGVAANPDLVLETDDEARQARIISKRDANFAATINLPCRVVAQQSVAPRTNELCLEAKLAAQPAATISSTSINSVITHAMDANELTRSSTRMFHCQACDRPLADYGANLVAQDLPSEHWGEMMEAWMCHSDPSWTARLARMQDEGFWPKARQVLCGGSYLLVHGDSVERRNISVAQTKIESGWTQINCVCGEAIGNQRAEDGKPGAGVVKLQKWAVYGAPADGAALLRYPLSVFVMSDLLESARAHATYRFSIRDSSSGERRLLLWLFNPSIGVAYKRGSPSAMPSPARAGSKSPMSFSRRPSTPSGLSVLSSSSSLPPSSVLRAGKVLYKVVDSLTDTADVAAILGTNSQVEDLAYSKTFVERLIAMLRDSTAVYPLSRRSMNGLEVGFLERI